MPQSKPKRPRAQGGANAAAGNGALLKVPFLDICKEAGWAPQHLAQAASSKQELTGLLIKELVACREAGKIVLTLALCDAAEARGLGHPRIAANRERARRVQQRQEAPVVSPVVSSPAKAAKGPGKSKGRAKIKGKGKGKGIVKRQAKGGDSRAKSPAGRTMGFWQRLIFALGLKSQSTPSNRRRSKLPITAKAGPELGTAAKRGQQLESLKALCLQAGWAPQCLQSDDGDDVALACALEMQRCRQAGQHALVVALATQAAVLGLEHPRIQDNLQRSRGKAAKANVLAQARGLLECRPPAFKAAAQVLAEAILADPDSQEYRKLLVDAVRGEIEQGNLSSLAPELRNSTVDLEVNERLLAALESRRASA